MTLYIIGFALIIPKFVQALIETITSKRIPMGVALSFTLLLNIGVFLCVLNMIFNNTVIWFVLPMTIALYVVVFLIMKMERDDIKKLKNE